MTEQPVYITQQELAARWKVTVRTFERWRAEHEGPTWYVFGGSIRYWLEDVEAFELSRRCEVREGRVNFDEGGQR